MHISQCKHNAFFFRGFYINVNAISYENTISALWRKNNGLDCTGEECEWISLEQNTWRMRKWIRQRGQEKTCSCFKIYRLLCVRSCWSYTVIWMPFYWGRTPHLHSKWATDLEWGILDCQHHQHSIKWIMHRGRSRRFKFYIKFEKSQKFLLHICHIIDIKGLFKYDTNVHHMFILPR